MQGTKPCVKLWISCHLGSGLIQHGNEISSWSAHWGHVRTNGEEMEMLNPQCDLPINCQEQAHCSVQLSMPSNDMNRLNK